MAEQNTLRLPCKYLRSKEMYYLGVSASDGSPGDTFWCHKTQECFGPDGQPAGHEECASSRTCYLSE